MYRFPLLSVFCFVSVKIFKCYCTKINGSAQVEVLEKEQVAFLHKYATLFVYSA